MSRMLEEEQERNEKTEDLIASKALAVRSARKLKVNKLATPRALIHKDLDNRYNIEQGMRMQVRRISTNSLAQNKKTKAESATAYPTIKRFQRRSTETQLLESQRIVEVLHIRCTKLDKRPT